MKDLILAGRELAPKPEPQPDLALGLMYAAVSLFCIFAVALGLASGHFISGVFALILWASWTYIVWFVDCSDAAKSGGL